MKTPLLIFLLAPLLVGAAQFVEWRPEFELWLNSCALPLAVGEEQNEKLPFDEPRVDFSPSPVWQKISLSAWKSFAALEPYFLAPQWVAPKNSLGVWGKRKVEMPEAIPVGEYRFYLTAEGECLPLFEGTSAALFSAATELLSGNPEGVYLIEVK
jgi:hypothetical protein